MKIDPDKLEALIVESGLRGRAADKLRRANDPESSARGHGAASQETTPIEL